MSSLTESERESLIEENQRWALDHINAQDAQIDRLKAENESLIEQFRAIREICYSKDKIVIELANALDVQSCWSTKVELIQRAKEATNEEIFGI